MSRFGIIDREFKVVNNPKLYILKEAETQSEKLVFEALLKYGMKSGGGIVFDMGTVADSLGFSKVNFKAYIEGLQKNGKIRYEKPFRGKPTKVIGNISEMDWDNWYERRMKAHEKLDSIVDYHNCPDADKHKFLLAYFGIES